MTMKIGKNGIELIKRWEGYHKKLPDGRCQAYLDKLVRPALRSPGYDGLWTIGYGCTEGVYEGLVWTEKQAEDNLMLEVNKHVGYVNNLLEGVKVNQNQFDALVSFSYNLGPGWLRKSDTPNGLLGLIKAGKHEQASRRFMAYVNAGGRKVQGLVNRRNDEMRLFNSKTKNELVENSRRFTWMERLKGFFATLSVGTYFTWENFSQVKTFVNDNAGFFILGFGLLAFLSYKLIEYFSMNEYNEGRYTPSGVIKVGDDDEELTPIELPAEVLKTEISDA